jgi:hypothetical protein
MYGGDPFGPGLSGFCPHFNLPNFTFTPGWAPQGGCGFLGCVTPPNLVKLAVETIFKRVTGMSLPPVDLILSILRDPIGTARAIVESVLSPTVDLGSLALPLDGDGTLTEEELKQARIWLQEAHESIVKIFNENRAPAPKNWQVESKDISQTVHPEDPTIRGRNIIQLDARGVSHGRITIYPPAAGSFDEVFVTLGHEIGHFYLVGLSEEQLDDYGRGLLRVHKGGKYDGPAPPR